jgi:hypothetical protein
VFAALVLFFVSLFDPQAHATGRVVHHHREPFIILMMYSEDAWVADAVVYYGRARCESARVELLKDEYIERSYTSLQCVPYSADKHGRLDGPKPPKGDTTQGALVTEHSVIYAMMAIGGRGGLLMSSAGDPYF